MFSKKIKCVVLDFDNTIAATEQYSWLAHNKSLEKYGVYLNSQYIKKYIGHPDNEIFAMIEQDFNIKIDYNTHYSERLKNYIDLILNSDLKPYYYINELLDLDLKFYILSSNSEFAIRKILKHWGIENKFEKVYSMLDMNLKKSYALENSKTFFGFDQSEIVVFEDSPNTINLANSLGCETVFIDNGDNNLKCNYDFKIDVGSDYAKESTRI